MIDNIVGKLLVIYIIMYSSRSFSTAQLALECSTWNQTPNLIYGRENKSAGNDDNSLNLTTSSLAINRQTDEIAVLDDNNGRILVFNQSNTSTLLVILFDLSNSTNFSMMHFPSSTIAYDQNNSMYILDGSIKEIVKMANPLDFGQNATVMTIQYLSNPPPIYSGARGLCVDDTDQSLFITINDSHQVFRYNQTNSIITNYVGSTVPGNTSSELCHPTSIVMDNNRRLYVNDVGNDRIQVFAFNSTNARTLPTNITGCIALSFHSPDILVMNTRTAIYLFNLTDNVTTFAVGCSNSQLNDTHNALIDNVGNIIVTESNVVYSYAIRPQCLDVTTQSTMTTTTALRSFNPVNNCSNGTFGTYCSFSTNICNVTQPCVNSGQCTENHTNGRGYNCQCPTGFQGINCQYDRQPCQRFTCFERGNCTYNISSNASVCQCLHGYEGVRCERTVNMCANVTCENRGICFREYLKYTCQCLSGFHGRHCETPATSTLVRGYVSKSFGYIAILMLSSVVGFFVVMDILKYIFGIDPVRSQRHNVRKKRELENSKKKKKPTQPKVIHRVHYVN